MPKSSDGDYEVGYRQPPRQTRFQTGQSGNPKGRPYGAKNLTTLLGQALAERVVVSENGRRRKLTKLAATCKQLVNRALSGDLRAMKLLLELIRAIEGKASVTQVNVLIEQQMAADARILADLSRLTLEELREYRRLEAKALGELDLTEIEAVKAPEVPDQAAVPANAKPADTKEGA